MRLVTYRSTVEAAARLGAVVDDLVVDVEEVGKHAGVSLPSSMLDFIDLGPPALAALKKILNGGKDHWPVGAALPLANVRLLAPIPRPRKNIFGIGLNYVIATGTPEGVGARRSPQEWLWPGDVVEAEVTGIGRLRHPVVAI